MAILVGSPTSEHQGEHIQVFVRERCQGRKGGREGGRESREVFCMVTNKHCRICIENKSVALPCDRHMYMFAPFFKF